MPLAAKALERLLHILPRMFHVRFRTSGDRQDIHADTTDGMVSKTLPPLALEPVSLYRITVFS